MAATPEIPKPASNAEDQQEAQAKRTKDAIAEVEAAYSKAERKIRTERANFNEDVLRKVVTMPLMKIGEDVDAAIVKADGKMIDEAKATEFENRRQRAVDLAKSYIDRMASEGGLNPEAITRMCSDQNRKASRFADLLMSGKYPKLEQAMLFSLGSRGESASLSAAGEEAQKTILEYLNAEIDNDDSEVMPTIWSILSFMEKDPRTALAKAYIKGKPTNKVEAFLNRASSMGIFDWKEMQELNENKQYTEADKKWQQENWEAQNNFKLQAAQLAQESYGTKNAAGEMINLRNGLLLIIKAGAGLTLAANFFAGGWQGGKFRGIIPAAKRFVNPQSAAAIGVYGFASVLESNKTFDEIFNGNDDKKEASGNLKKEIKSNAAWDGFFKTEEYAGARVFFDFVSGIKGQESDISKVADLITPSQFEAYLDVMAAKKTTGDKNINYAAIRESFKAVKPREIYSLAKSFDTLNIGGSTAKDEYEKYTKDPTSEKVDKDKKVA